MRCLLVFAALTPAFAQTTCSYTITPADQSTITAPAAATTGTVMVSTTANCPWSFGTDSSTGWLTFSSSPLPNQQGLGSGSFNWMAAANPTPAARQGKIYIAGMSGALFVLTISQAGATCTLSQSPSSVALPVTGGAGMYQVKTNCTWFSASIASWVTIPPNTGGTTDGTVNYTVASNGCVQQRTGIILVQSADNKLALLQFQIMEDGSAKNLSLSSSGANVPQGVTDDSFIINTGDGCAWAAFSDVSWIQLTSSASGSGSSRLAYHIPANTGGPRTGSIHVSAPGTSTQLTFAVTQAAAPPPPVQLNSIVNGASYAGGAVSPGEIVTLGGVNIGPTPAALLQLTNGGQSVTTTLGGTRVLFDGVAAPLIYASAQQINAVVPYSVAGKTATQVQVQYQGTNSNVMPVAVQATTPGIFALDASGLGGGAILNQDYSINQPAVPAVIGSVVAIYCTGGGVTNPASADGSITGTPLPMLTAQPVTVTIGGQSAQVAYAGGAPGSIAGLTQIDAIVPAGVTPGRAIPVVVQIGSASSQTGITLAVSAQ